MRSEAQAIVCALRNHGEHGAIVRLMTSEQGLIAAYVRGARGRRMRPVLMAGNVVQTQLAGGQVAISLLLGAQQAFLQTSLARVQADAARLADTVALFQAVGGGWWNRRKPVSP